MKALFGENHKYSAALTKDLFTVEDGAVNSYGGSQNMYATEKERTCGCGIAGAVDIVLYIESVHSKAAAMQDKIKYSKSVFLAKSEEIRKLIPIIPGRGVNSFLLAMGMNKYFRRHKMKYHAHWKWTSIKKWEIIERMLKDDIPVIIAIGNNFPAIWGRHELNLYVKDESKFSDEQKVFRKQGSVCGHFVVATAIEGNCLTVSSWGRKYYINIDEYNQYVKKHSTHLYSNILEIRKR